MSYYVMSTQYSGDYYLDSVAKYDNDKWAISGDAPKDFKGEIVDLSHVTRMPENTEYTDVIRDTDMLIEDIVTLIDNMRAETPTGRLLIIPQWVGLWLYRNHEVFKPVTVEAPS